ncbi:MAG: hypothetical protein PUB21_11310 [Bacteroidales bacterium]|nr:hypothetical protein [Bacteroidales bacterium]
MDTKIQELTEKLYQEGVEKGNQEAARLIQEAKTQSAAIIKDAEEKANAVLADAAKKAAEQKKNVESELKLFAGQSVEALKSEIANLITDKIVSSDVKSIVSDQAFLQEFIVKLATQWLEKENLVIQTADAEALKSYFMTHAKELMDKGIKIEKVNGKPASFVLLPEDGSYKITFGEDQFIAYFKEFLRPRLVEMLF